jgi:hypothetical protein
MRTDHSTVISAVKAAQRLLAESIDRATDRSDRETITRLLELMDNETLNRAVDRMEKRKGLRKAI